MKKKTSSPKTAESGKLKKALSCWQLYILLIPALIWLIVFAYYPMYGLIIAFKDFKGRMGIMGSPWADPIFKYFKMFFSTSIAMTAIKNTIVISLESLIIGFPIPVIFALLLNQVQRSGPRRIIQTISYAPYFMSNVVVVSLISVLFSANGEDLIAYPQAMEGTSYTIPDTVREIWTSAFSNTKLTDVTFPDGLLYIDDWAFASSALTSLDLPDTVTEIGQYAFAYCTGISEIDMPKNLELIQAAAFAGETSLTKVTFYDGLTDIQMAAFAGTGLKEVTIP